MSSHGGTPLPQLMLTPSSVADGVGACALAGLLFTGAGPAPGAALVTTSTTKPMPAHLRAPTSQESARTVVRGAWSHADLEAPSTGRSSAAAQPGSCPGSSDDDDGPAAPPATGLAAHDERAESDDTSEDAVGGTDASDAESYVYIEEWEPGTDELELAAAAEGGEVERKEDECASASAPASDPSPSDGRVVPIDGLVDERLEMGHNGGDIAADVAAENMAVLLAAALHAAEAGDSAHSEQPAAMPAVIAAQVPRADTDEHGHRAPATETAPRVPVEAVTADLEVSVQDPCGLQDTAAAEECDRAHASGTGADLASDDEEYAYMTEEDEDEPEDGAEYRGPTAAAPAAAPPAAVIEVAGEIAAEPGLSRCLPAVCSLGHGHVSPFGAVLGERLELGCNGCDIAADVAAENMARVLGDILAAVPEP